MKPKIKPLPPLLRDARRIVFLGDDLTDCGRYPAYVVNSLNRTWPDAAFEWVNAGRRGATPGLLLEHFQSEGIKVGPELVIVGFGAGVWEASPDAFGSDLDKLVQAIHDSGSEVLVIRTALPADAAAAARRVLDALGCADVDVDREGRPDPHQLTGWERVEPIPGAFGEREVDPATVFRQTQFDAPAEGTMELQLGGVPPVTVWLNGREVWRSEQEVGRHPNAARLDVTVARGRNEITMASDGEVFAGVKPISSWYRVDGHRVRRNAVPMGARHRKELAQRDRINRDVLDNLGDLPTGGRLTGTFIYAHALGYRGRNTLRYGVAEWRGLFRELKELGMDMAVLGTAAVTEPRECFYPSRLFSEFQTWNLIEPMLAAAAEERMKIYLGGVGVSEALIGAETGDEGLARSCADRELACYRELAERYRGAFHGYYLASETGFWSWGNPDYLTRCFRTYFQRVTNGVKEITPEVPIFGSPYTVRCPGREQEAIDTLVAVHAGCPFTALAPQDSIGVSMNDLGFLDKGLEIWKTVCREIGAEFWVNCENFNIDDFGGPLHPIVPAPFKRLSLQLDTAERMGARKLITWEAIHFMNPAGSRAARRLRRDYLHHRAMER